MNPISSNNFKYAIGNLPIKVSRDDDMLFSFRNQVVTNRSIKESETSQLPESINSRHGEITYLLTSLEDRVSSFVEGFKLCLEDIDDSLKNEIDSFKIDDSFDCEFKNNSISDFENQYEEDSLVTLMQAQEDEFDNDKQFEDLIDEEEFNERRRNEDHHYISDSITKAKSIEPKTNMVDTQEKVLDFTRIDPMSLGKSSTTPKSKAKRIKPQVSVIKSAKSTRATMPSSKKSTKSKPKKTVQTSERKIRNIQLTEESKPPGRRRVSKISKKSMDRICSNPNEKSGGKYLIPSPDNSLSGRGVIKFFSLKKSTSRNVKGKNKVTSVSTNRCYVKKSNILHTSKGSSSGRMDTSSKSQNNRKGHQISFYPAPQSLRIKREEEPRLEDNCEILNNKH